MAKLFAVFLVLFFSGFFSVMASAADIQTRIVGGSPIFIQQASWQAALFKKTNLSSLKSDLYCGASIIHASWILTAAHCHEQVANAGHLGFVGIGISDLDNPDSTTQLIEVKSFYPHQDYNDVSLDNDVALIELARPIDFEACGDSCQIIDLLQNEEEITLMPFNTPVLVSGWGSTDPEAEVYPNLLQSVEVYIKDCTDSLRSSEAYTDNMICATAPNKDSCVGDSGGPLVVLNGLGAYSLAGLTSWGPPICSTYGDPGVYTRIANYACWVESNTGSDVPARQHCSALAGGSEDNNSSGSLSLSLLLILSLLASVSLWKIAR